jgi:hypothetical protein
MADRTRNYSTIQCGDAEIFAAPFAISKYREKGAEIAIFLRPQLGLSNLRGKRSSAACPMYHAEARSFADRMLSMPASPLAVVAAPGLPRSLGDALGGRKEECRPS